MRILAVAVVGGVLTVAAHIGPSKAASSAPACAEAVSGVRIETAYTRREWRHRWWSNHHWNYR